MHFNVEAIKVAFYSPLNDANVPRLAFWRITDNTPPDVRVSQNGRHSHDLVRVYLRNVEPEIHDPRGSSAASVSGEQYVDGVGSREQVHQAL